VFVLQIQHPRTWDRDYPDLTDRDYERVANWDLTHYGHYLATRRYPFPPKPPEEIWGEPDATSPQVPIARGSVGMVLTPMPSIPICFTCGGTAFSQRDRDQLCSRCHPDPDVPFAYPKVTFPKTLDPLGEDPWPGSAHLPQANRLLLAVHIQGKRPRRFISSLRYPVEMIPEGHLTEQQKDLIKRLEAKKERLLRHRTKGSPVFGAM
jgi:hypothetical protein